MSHHLEITLIRPDDWHCHLRDQAFLERTVTDTARQFNRAIVMPNLSPPITDTAMAEAYRKRIKAHLPEGSAFQPLMTLYLTENMPPNSIAQAKGLIHACKLYPAGATTHSDAGVRDIHKIYPLLEAMQEADLPLLIHGEVVDPKVDIFDREAVFIERHLSPLCRDFPNLRIVLEHISSKVAVEFVTQHGKKLAATITPHHLLFNRNDLLTGGLRPHLYCLPIIKTTHDREALINAAISGNPQFFLGTDSAPHTKSSKESCCGAAGIYSAHAAIELYAEIFANHRALDKLENFASRFGAQFYGLPLHNETMTLINKPWKVPSSLPFGDEVLIPLMAGKIVSWQIKS